MITDKKCKGNGQAKGYGCNKLTDVKYRKYGLCTSCYAEWLYTSDAGKVKLNKAINKVTKPRLDLERAKQDKKANSLPKALKQTQDVFNKYIRLRDRYKPCISENISWQSDFDAGHYYSVKQFGALRFNEDNVHGQSQYGNRFKEGNFEMYSINIVSRIGEERLEALNKLANEYKSKPKKWTLSELEEIRNKYNKLIKELE